MFMYVYEKRSCLMRLIIFVLAIFLIMPYVCAKNINESSINYVEINSEDTADSKYTFDDNAMSGKVVKLKKGTELSISLTTPIDTSTAKENDIVEAVLNNNLVIDNVVAAEQGSIVKGKIIKARSGSSGIRNGKVSIVFDKIITTENRTFNISTKKIDFVVSEEGKWISATKTFMLVLLAAACVVCSGGAGIGAVVIGAFFLGKEIRNKKGSDVMIPALTPIEVAVDSSVNVIGNYQI